MLAGHQRVSNLSSSLGVDEHISGLYQQLTTIDDADCPAVRIASTRLCPLAFLPYVVIKSTVERLNVSISDFLLPM